MSDVSANNKRIAKNTLFLYVRLLFAMAVGLYTSRVILAVLGQDDFGLNSVVGSIVVMFYFLNNSMSGATSRFLTFELGRKDYDKLKKTFSAALTIHIAIATIVVLLGETVGLWYLENKMVIPEGRMIAARWVYHLSLLSAVITITQVPYSAVIIAREKMDVYAYIEIVKTLLQLGIVFLLIIGNFDKLILYAILTVCISLAITLIYRGYCIARYAECRYEFHTDKEIIKPMLGFSGWSLYTDLAYQAQGSGTNVILNLFFGTVVNAAYGIGLQLSRAVYSFISNFTMAVKPQIIKYYSTGQIREMESLMNSTTRYSFFMLFTLAIPIIMETDFLLEVWLKNPPEYSAMFCRLSLVMMLLNILWINLTYATQATNKMRLASIVTGTLYILIPIISYIALKLEVQLVYLPMLIAIGMYVFVVIARLLIVKKLIPQLSVSRYCKNVLFLSALTATVGSVFPLCVHHYMGESWLRLILTCAASAVSMAVATYCLGMGAAMRQKVKAVVLKKLHLE